MKYPPTLYVTTRTGGAPDVLELTIPEPVQIEAKNKQQVLSEENGNNWTGTYDYTLHEDLHYTLRVTATTMDVVKGTQTGDLTHHFITIDDEVGFSEHLLYILLRDSKRLSKSDITKLLSDAEEQKLETAIEVFKQERGFPGHKRESEKYNDN